MRFELPDWNVTCGHRSPKFFVKGTELAYVLYAHSRFKIAETRCLNEDRSTGVQYLIYDAATVSDDEVREGKKSRMVAHYPTFDDAIKYCDIHYDN